MLDEMMKQVMDNFSKAKSVIGSIAYDMLLVNNKEDTPSYYLWRANSNHRSSSSREETLLIKDYHQLYLFGKRATDINLSELNIEFESSGVVIAEVLTIVFTFSSVWREAAAGDGVSKTNKNKRKRSTPQKKKTDNYPPSTARQPPAKKAKNNPPEKNSEKRKPSKRKTKSIESSSSNVLIDNIMPIKNSVPPLPPTSSQSSFKKNKTNTNLALHFFTKIVEKVFTDRFDKVIDKLLQHRSS